MLDPFQPGPNFGNFSGSKTSGIGFKGAVSGVGFGRHGADGLNRLDEPAMSERQNRAVSSFLMSGTAPGARSSANAPFGATSATVPAFNQLLRGKAGLRLNSNFGDLKLSRKDAARPFGSLGDPGIPSASAWLTTSDLGNGVFLSAGAGSGSRSMAGAPAATLGNGTPGGQKHSGPSLALKLSF